MTKTPQANRILVAGANGRLGRLLQGAERAVKTPLRQVVFAARSGESDLPAFDATAIPDDLAAADMVVGLWGVTSGTPAALARNSHLARATRELARITGARIAVHLSSAGVYGPGEALTETSPARPASDYGRAKLEMEKLVADMEDEGLAHCCLRLANVVGADSLAPALQGTGPVTLTRFGNGRGPLRSYIAPSHLLEVLRHLSALPPARLPAIVNVAASTPVEMEALARAAGKEIEWTQATPADRQRVTLSTTRLAALLPALPLSRTPQQMITDWQQAKAAT